MHNVFNFMMVNTEFQTNMSPTETALSIRHTSEPPDKMPKWQCSQTVFKVRHMSEPTDKKAQTVLCAQKRCLPCHALVDLTVLELLSSSRSTFLFHGGVHISWQSSAKQGRNRENPWNKRFHQLPGTFPPKPLWGLASQEQWPPHSHSSQCAFHHGHCSAGGGRVMVETPGSQVSRDYSSLTRDAKTPDQK